MCVVNPLLIQGLSRLVGTQLEVMTRLGISWNTWTKIRSGQPVKLSLGRRLRSRVVEDPVARDVVRREGTSARLRKLDADDLERMFLLSTCNRTPGGPANELFTYPVP